jgi:hypothetical protein
MKKEKNLSFLAFVIVLGIYLCALKPVQAQYTKTGKYVIENFLDYKGPSNEIFPRAFGIAFDNQNQMFMICGDNTGYNHIFKVNRNGKYSEFANMKASFSGPGIDIDKDNNIFIAAGDILFKINPEGKIDTLFNDFVKAGDVKLDNYGNMFIIDFGEYRIYKITPALNRTIWIDNYDGKTLEFKTGGIMFDRSYENLLVCDNTGNKITKYHINKDGTAGEATPVIEKYPPFWVAYGPNNSIFFTDWLGNRIIRVANDKAIETINFPNTPIGISAGKGTYGQDTLYVTDNYGIKKLYWTENININNK